MKRIYKSMLAVGLIASGAFCAQPALADDVVATGTFTVKPLDGNTYQWGNPVDIKIAVMDAGETTNPNNPEGSNPIYYITETDDQGYLEYNVKFEYNPGENGSAIFNQEYRGVKDGNHIWSAITQQAIEVQGEITVPFTLENGFNFVNPKGDPLGILFLSSSHEDRGINPDLNYLHGILITAVKDWTYPALSEGPGGGDEGDDPEVFTPNPDIAGNWTFNINSDNSGKESWAATATIDGNTLAFKLPYETIYMDFTGANTLTVTKRPIVTGTSTNVIGQMPFVDPSGNTDMYSLTEESYTLTYDPESYSLEFPDGAGIAIGYINQNTGAWSYASEAYRFISLNKTPVLEFDGTPTYSVEGSTFSGSLAYNAANIPSTATIQAIFKNANGGNDLTLDVTENPQSFSFTDLENGEYKYNVTLQALTSDGNALITSSAQTITFTVDVAPTASYPAFKDLLGVYNFSSQLSFESNAPANLQNFLGSSFTFTLTSPNPDSNTGTISGFLFEDNSCAVEYDPETGVLTYKGVYKAFPNGIGNIYFAPEGNYTGFSPNVANYPKFQISPEGEWSMKPLQIGTCAALAGPFTEYGEYSNIVITSGTVEEETNFEGTYTFTGTKYTYNADKSIAETEQNNTLTVKINNNNQVVEIMGYELTAQQVEWDYNAGKGKGDVYTLVSGPYTGVNFAQKELGENLVINNDLIGGSSIASYDQDEDAIVITKNEDGTYSIAPFTIWNKTQEYVDPSDTSKGTTFVNTLLYRWEEGEAQEQVSFAGTYELTGTYYNYTDGQQTSTSDGSFTFEINSANQIVQIAGTTIDKYDLADGRNIGEADGNILTWSASMDLGLNWEGDLILIGGESTDNYVDGSTVSFELGQDNATLSPFTVWRRTVDSSTMNISYTLLYKWDDTPYVPEPVILPGTYQMTGTFIVHSSEDGEEVYDEVKYENGDFTLEINDSFQPVQFAGYTMDTRWDEPNYGKEEGNTVIWTAGFPDGMQFDAYTNDSPKDFYIGGSSTEDLIEGDEIIFTKVSDTSYSLTPFTVWVRKWSNEAGGPINVLYKEWTSDTTVGVDSIILEQVKTEYFDLQGRKVNNPSSGIYIVKSGKTVKKVFVK